ncbi:Y-family DNA polymerase [Enterococcus sp. BWT-B8]|uniref:Y-family DNA polymerase n=1 Tax=Enterococcus sp. BWT-B8 TaxID=2885157 RepID=UPI001E600172|nr:Y-family DNA polymerase [Enterococcus sp. BWT-B8]MCB5952279.1 Y-family DNA polymerase [Enterococcus sp. BWT-B8]
MKFDYDKEERRDILCIDVKSFYASVECIQMGLDPLETMLVVMSNAENAGGLILSASPMAKSALGLSNVMRKWDLPDHPDLLIVPPRMQLYINENMKINSIFKQYTAVEDILIYSIDETFLDITASKKLFGKNTFELAEEIQKRIKEDTGLHVTIGIGDNPLLAKAALDVESKQTVESIAEWRYEDVPDKLWKIYPITEMWGINSRTAKRLHNLNIHSIFDLAHANEYKLKEELGVIGLQLYAHSWGIDRTRISDTYVPAEKSFNNNQILPRDYRLQTEIETVLQEVTDQVAARLRKHNAQTQCVSLYIGYSSWYRKQGNKGFRQQMKVPPTNQSKLLKEYILELFRHNWTGMEVRQVGVSFSKLVETDMIQLDLFHEPADLVNDYKLDHLIDAIRKKYGFTSIVHANSLLSGGTAISRASLIGGHAGGMDGLRSEYDAEKN